MNSLRSILHPLSSVAVLALLLTGCAHYRAQPLAPDKTAAQLDARRLDDAGLRKFIETNSAPVAAWPKTNWNFSELTLVAFYFHPSLEVARDQWLAARAGVKTAGARPNPSFTAAPEYNTTTDVPSPWGPMFSLDLPIETAGKRGKRVAQAQKAAESARWNYASAAWQTRSGVRDNLMEQEFSGRRAGLLQAQYAAQSEIVKLLQGRFDAGEISRPELTAAQVALNKLQLDLGDARAKSAEARSRLAQSLGLPQPALDGVALDFHYPSKDAEVLTSAASRRLALCSRADILAALADYAAAEAELQLEIAKQYPDLHLGPTYQYDQGDNKWSLAITVELPIFNQNQGPIAEARARRKLSAAKFIELQSQVIAEIDRATAGFRVAQAQLRDGRKLLAAEAQQQQAVEGQIAAGASDKLDLLAAQMEFSSAALTQLDNEARLQSALGALEDALQCPADAAARVIRRITTDNPNAQPAKAK